MQLRQEANTEPRKKFHLVSRLRKATSYALQLQTLCEVSIFLYQVDNQRDGITVYCQFHCYMLCKDFQTGNAAIETLVLIVSRRYYK